jgi:hypothetical protein
MFLKSFILLLVMFNLSSCATTPVETPSQNLSNLPTEKPIEGFTHIVQKGETLWHISKIYHMGLEDIIKANRLSDSSTIAPGQAILIPKIPSKNMTPEIIFTAREDTEFIWPLKGKVITRFKEKIDGVASKGIDILTDSPQNILAVRSGKVIFADNLIGYGSTIIIDHGDGLSTLYCGNADVSVRAGEEVKQGSVIAKTGKTGRPENGSLHFEIRQRHKPQNPLFYLS